MKTKRKLNLNIGQIIAIIVVIIIAAITLIIFTLRTNNTDILSNTEAIKLAKEKYEKVTEYYWMDGNSEDTITPNENDNWYELIDNYDEITNNLTNNYLQKFTTYRPIIKQNGKYYIRTIARGGNIYYYGNDEFEIKSITDNRMEFIVKERYCVNAEDLGKDISEITEFEYQNNSFVLVKENEEWKVDEFILPT